VNASGSTWVATGQESDLLTTEDSDSPVKPFGGVEQFQFAPDKDELAYTMQDGTSSSIAWSTDLNIYTVTWDSGKLTSSCITCNNTATDEQPAYSPDGKYIAYLRMAIPQYESDKRQIYLYERSSGNLTVLVPNWVYSPESLYWSDNSTIYFTVQINATSRIYSINITDQSLKEITLMHHTSSVFVIGTKLIYAQDAFQFPSNFFLGNISDVQAAPRILTDYNNAKLEAINMVPSDQFWFNGWNNEPVQAWVFNPPNFQESAKSTYPLAFIIHGGPQSAILDAWSFRWNPQAWAGNNYTVVIVNFHGSSSFGQNFTDSIQGDWGGKPFVDLMAGLEAALAKFSWINKDKVCALGASYGGYMINWINSQLVPGIFKCLVVHDGVFSTDGSYYTTEEIFFDEHEFNGAPWQSKENFENYIKWSPARSVVNDSVWKTPALVIHGGHDFRLVDSQGFSVFTMLQKRGVQSTLLYFPTESHWVTNPDNSMVWYQNVMEWLDGFLKSTNNNPTQSNFPLWAIIVIAVGSVAFLGLILYAIYHYRGKSKSGYQRINDSSAR